MTIRNRYIIPWTAALALAVVLAQPAFGVPAPTLPSAADRTTREVKVSFAELGADLIALHGMQSSAGINFGVRADEVVVGAQLKLHLTYSPSLLQELSHLRIGVNGQTVAALALSKADAGHEVERIVTLDPRYLSDYNQIQFDLIGHYALDCEDPQHSSLWASISRLSELQLTVQPLVLRDDLGLLPEPFFDRHDNRRLVLPIVLPKGASRQIVRSAGLAASWFGTLADYRGARFPVSFDTVPEQHALVFATNASQPAALALRAVHAPTVSVIDHPAHSTVKLLVFQGEDELQLRQAVEGLVLGNAVLTGSSATVGRVFYQRRAAYDAPRWLRTDRAIKLGELIEAPEQLQARGVAPAPVNVNLHLPPDLFTWNRAGVPVDLHYRFTAPVAKNNSLLNVSINNQLLRSYRLAPETDNGTAGRLLVPLLQGDSSRESNALVIPAFQIASNNLMQFQFTMDVHREGMCKGISIDDTRAAIDPDSTIDISIFPHYTALPNLALFANAGYPFTRYADLAETAIVLPDASDPLALEQLFFLLGRMGRQTGAVALGYQLLEAREALAARDVDLLILSGAAANDLLARWGRNLALVFGEHGREFEDLPHATNAMTVPAPRGTEDPGPAPRVTLQAGGSLGALMGFESRVSSGRSVVALIGSNAAAAQSLVATLEDESKVPLIRGELAIVRNNDVQSFQGAEVYYVGSLSWWQWLWFHFSRHVWLLTLVSLATAVALGLLLYGLLQRRVAKRLEARGA